MATATGTSAEEVAQLQARVRALEAEAAEARGAFAEVMKQLEKEFGVKSLPAAEALLAKLEKQEQQAAQAYQTAVNKFKQEYAEELGL